MLVTLLLFFVLHAFVWFSTNYQLMNGVENSKALLVCLLLAIPTSLLSFYSTKIAYQILETAWSVRLFAFAVGYFVFPILTWVFLNESPFNTKTITSMVLAFTIVGIQLFFPDS